MLLIHLSSTLSQLDTCLFNMYIYFEYWGIFIVNIYSYLDDTFYITKHKRNLD